MALFQNHQWEVTEYGVEAISTGLLGSTPRRVVPKYFLEAGRLLEGTERGEHQIYDWPVHLAEKGWVDMDAFIEAFLVALIVHRGRYSGDVNPMMLQATFARARADAKETQNA
ncbi:MAG TPA: hypothetical protein VHY79_09400 [Rhizomicrobium sp.]|nr:hypothetical protein [Rhizomicrobium sp.]